MSTHSPIVGVLALLLLPAIAAAQSPPKAATPSPSLVASRNALPASGTASLDSGRMFDVTKLTYSSCGADPRPDLPPRSGSAPYELGGGGVVGTSNPYDPAFSRIVKFGGSGGFGLDYVAPGNGFGLPGVGASYVYRLDRSGVHRFRCDLPGPPAPDPQEKRHSGAN
jgi:hypothetical protein